MKTYVYFSPVRWDSFDQRPHEFIKWLQSLSDSVVLWIEPHPTKTPTIRDLLSLNIDKVKVQKGSISGKYKNLRLISPPLAPIEHMRPAKFLRELIWRPTFKRILNNVNLGGDMVVIVGKPSQLVIDFINNSNPSRIFYDAMDDFPNFYSGKDYIRILEVERDIAKKSHMVWVTTPTLEKKFRAFVNAVKRVPNGFDRTRVLDLVKIASKKHESLTAGYLGTIAAWFDWNLVSMVAIANPEVRFKMIGPVYSRPNLSKLPGNVEILGALENKTALVELSKCHLGIIPFQVNELTASVDPLKYYEYRALDLPVFTTKFGAMTERIGENNTFELLPDVQFSKFEFEVKQNSETQDAFFEKHSWSSSFDKIKKDLSK